MSQLVSKLKRISKGESKPIGFASRQSAVRGRMVLVAGITEPDAFGDISFSGVDAVLIHPVASLTNGNLQTMTKSLPDLPWGVWPDVYSDFGALTGAGADYVVFTLESPVETLDQAGKAGRLLKVDSSLADSAIRGLNDLAIDALLLEDDGLTAGPMSLERVLLVNRFASVLAKPLLVLASPELNSAGVKALWMAGADGIVIEPGRKSLPEKISAIAGVMDQIGLPARKRGHSEALVPFTSSRPEAVEEEEEEP